MDASVLRLGLLLLLCGSAAESQTLRTVVVPADAQVVIPPRGQGFPAAAVAAPLLLPPATTSASPLATPVPVPVPVPPLRAAAPLGLAAGSGLLLPLVAGALLGGSLAGGGGGTAAPAVTR